MPKPNEIESKREASRQLNKKLRLEKRLSKKMRRLLRRINRDMKRVFDESGFVITAEPYRDEFGKIIDDHWKKTTAQFAPIALKVINDALKKEGEPPIKKTDPVLMLALAAFISRNVQESADKITRTSTNNIAKAMRQTEGDAAASKKKLDHIAAGRSETIAATETQKAAEGAKRTTMANAPNISPAVALGAIVLRSFKQWVTRGDGKVRPDHSAADFQEVPVDDPFFVGGELLMYPGDTSLGASLWNIINCRCVALYRSVTVRVRRVAG